MTTIRTALPSDVDAIHALGETVSEFSVNDTTVTFWPKPTLLNAIASDDVVVLVAEKNKEIIGFIIAAYNAGLSKATIENVYVAPSSRGEGVGNALLAQLLTTLRDIQCDYVATLIPTNAQKAAQLYTNAGFSSGETFLWMDLAVADTFKSV